MPATVPRLSRVDAEFSPPSRSAPVPWGGLRLPKFKFSLLRGGRRRAGTLSRKPVGMSVHQLVVGQHHSGADEDARVMGQRPHLRGRIQPESRTSRSPCKPAGFGSTAAIGPASVHDSNPRRRYCRKTVLSTGVSAPQEVPGVASAAVSVYVYCSGGGGGGGGAPGWGGVGGVGAVSGGWAHTAVTRPVRSPKARTDSAPAK
jgi:hypothetical protein